jgi:hypothetical protein
MAFPIPFPPHHTTSPSPPADMNYSSPRHYYDNDVEPSEVYQRDNYGSESSAAGLDDYDHPDPYGSSFPPRLPHTLNLARDYRQNFGLQRDFMRNMVGFEYCAPRHPVLVTYSHHSSIP